MSKLKILQLTRGSRGLCCSILERKYYGFFGSILDAWPFRGRSFGRKVQANTTASEGLRCLVFQLYIPLDFSNVIFAYREVRKSSIENLAFS